MHLGLVKDRYALLDQEFWSEQGGVIALATLQEAPEARRLRRWTLAGKPCGEDAYVALFEEHFQRG